MEHGPRPVEHESDFSTGVKLAQFSPSGQYVLTTSENGTVRLWSLKPSDEPWELLTARSEVESMSILDDETGAIRSLTQDEWKSRREWLLHMLRDRQEK